MGYLGKRRGMASRGGDVGVKGLGEKQKKKKKKMLREKKICAITRS